MGGNARTDGSDIVGRATELGAIGSFLTGVAAGTSGTLVVSGDAGVGKTALVQYACASAGSWACVLAGACLPLASLTVPFLALRSALRGAPRFDGEARPTLPQVGEAPHDVPVAIDGWLDQLCRQQPVVLIIDDLQWADQSTLDVLMYLVAGPVERRLAIVGTLRSGEIAKDHPLHRWLADIRRLPRIEWLDLGPLDRPDTGLQVSRILGTSPHRSLLQEIFAHTAGNAYLNRLSVAGLAPEARHLPAKLPSDLRDAVLRSWRGLSPEARQLTQLMAVGGRPVRARDLAAVARPQSRPERVLALLQEAANAGIAECSPDGTHWWFHHPLIAEVLEQESDEDGRQRWHGAFAAHEENRQASHDAPDFELLVALADHHYASGHTSDAYRWALRASAAAGHAGGATEMLRLLRRAVSLHSALPHPAESQPELWSTLRAAAEKTGAMAEELEAVEALLAGPGIGARPLDAAELLVRRAHLRFSMGHSFMTVPEMREAVRLSAVEPSSWQHALALAELAHIGVWKDEPETESCAAQALAIARAAGNPRALSYALTANAMVAVMGARAQEARAFAAEAVAAAVESLDFWAYVHATMWLANATETWTSEVFANLMRAGRQQLTELGAPHVYIAKMAAQEADSYLAIGRWRDCERGLRIALGSDPGIMGDAAARLTAARLAACQGRQDEAQAHLARAEEIYVEKSEYINLNFDAMRAQVCLAAGNPEAAYTAAMAGATAEGLAPTMCEWLVPLAARALADLIRLARDEGSPTAELEALIDDLVQRFPATLQELGEETELYTLQLAALNLIYAAEIGRARQGASNAKDWMRAADASQAATMPWEEAYSCWRAVESLLLHGPTQRGTARTILSRGLALSAELQAAPLQTQMSELAARARIDTTRPAVGGSREASAELPGLTPREREILEYVIAGRTYAEIARALVISEKTVSSHISNLLRKTGAANRLDLSRLATQSATRMPKGR